MPWRSLAVVGREGIRCNWMSRVRGHVGDRLRRLTPTYHACPRMTASQLPPRLRLDTAQQVVENDVCTSCSVARQIDSCGSAPQASRSKFQTHAIFWNLHTFVNTLFVNELTERFSSQRHVVDGIEVRGDNGGRGSDA